MIIKCQMNYLDGLNIKQCGDPAVAFEKCFFIIPICQLHLDQSKYDKYADNKRFTGLYEILSLEDGMVWKTLNE